MTLRELITKIGFDVDEKSAKNSEDRVKKMSVGMKAGMLAVAAAVFAIGKAALTAAGDMEMMTTQFEVMLGSADAAVKMMDDLKTFAASTPFALEDLARGTQQLLSFGVASDVVVDTMKLLGDTAGGDAEKLSGLVLAYGKVTTKGKASLEEINMMAERGIPIFDVLSKQMGTSKAELFKLISAGKVASTDITAAFQTMTSEGGMFFEGMQKQSLTFQGLVSTLKDNLKLMIADVGTAMLPVAKEIVGVLTRLIQGPLGQMVGSLMAILTPILEAVGVILEDVLTALMPLFDILISIMPLVTLILKIVIWAVKLVSKLVGWILKGASILISKIMPVLMFMIRWIKNIIFFYVFLYKQIFKLYALIFRKIWELAKTIARFFTDAIGAGFRKVMGWISAIGTFIQNIIAFVTGLVEKFWNWFAEKFPTLAGWILKIGEIFTNMWNSVKNVFVTIWTSIWDAITGSIAKLIGWIDKIPGVELKLPGIENGGIAAADAVADAALPGADDMFNPATTAAGKTANVDMQNTINMTVPPGTNAEGIKTMVNEAAQAIFTIEIQKVLVDAGY